MTLDEIGSLLALAIGVFPNMQDKDMGPTINVWNMMLKDIPYKTAEQALTKVLSTAKFFPTVAEIREAAAEITNPALPTASEAWGEVVQAVKNYGFYRETEALNSLSPAVAKIVRHIGWREICTCEEPDVIRGQFRRAWETQTKRDKELSVLPTEIRNLITDTTKKLSPGLKQVSGS